MRLAAAARWCAAGTPKALHVLAIVGGWAALTHGIASMTVPEVWWISLGLFGFSAAGWGHLRVLASAGVYALRRKAIGG
jgi:hypothetical protein